MPDAPDNAAPVRIDRWLCAARIYKSRSQAQDACEGGHVRINDNAARSSQLVKVGDLVRCTAPRARKPTTTRSSFGGGGGE